MRYLTPVQIAPAAGYLTTSRRTLDDIISPCGFDSDASLSKAFKRYYGIPPDQFRRQAARGPVLQVLDEGTGAAPRIERSALGQVSCKGWRSGASEQRE